MADAASIIAGQEVWISEIVDQEGDAGLHCSLKVNASRQPHIVYWVDQETSRATLMLARKEGKEWKREPVRKVRGSQTALAFDRKQRPWIAYYDLDAAAVTAGVFDNGWQLDAVPGPLRGFTVGGLSLALIGEMPVLSFWSDAGLQVARPRARSWRPRVNNWQIERVDDNLLAGVTSALALDPQSIPHIAYYDLDGESLKHARRNSAAFPAQPGWTSQILDSVAEGIAGEHSSIAINPATGRVHIAYSTSAGLRHVVPGAAPETLDAGAGNGLHPSIGLDSKGNPHVAYYDSNSGVLKIVHSDGTFQPPLFVDATGDVGGFASLAVATDEVIQIAYYDWAKRHLRFAQSVPAPQAVIRRIPGGRRRQFDLDGSDSTPDPSNLDFQWTVPPSAAATPGGINNPRLRLQFAVTGRFEIKLTVTEKNEPKRSASAIETVET